MDQELVDICNNIYETHKRALDLIFENRSDTLMQITKTCKDKLFEMAKQDANLIVDDKVCTKVYIRFTTKNLMKYIGEVSDNNGPWNTNSLSYYEFYFYKEEDKIATTPGLEFATKGASDTSVKQMINFMKKAKDLGYNRKSIRDTFDWQKVFGTKKHAIEYFDVDEIEAWFENEINSLLKIEKEILSQL